MQGQHRAGAESPHPVGPGLGAEIDQHRDMAQSREGTSTTLGHAEDPPDIAPAWASPTCIVQPTQLQDAIWRWKKGRYP